MKKLTLNLDELAVDSYEIAKTEDAARGTVHGNFSSSDLLRDYLNSWLACN